MLPVRLCYDANLLAPLPHSFNIKNTQDLLRNLKDTPVLPHYKLASLDVTNLYSNIPVLETKTILADILTQNIIDPKAQQELLKWFDVITKENYFAHKEQIVFEHDGLAMGVLSLGLITEIFIQHVEHSHLTHLMRKHNIINYCRYMDDILIVFDSTQPM
jgi:hypothetical protein